MNSSFQSYIRNVSTHEEIENSLRAIRQHLRRLDERSDLLEQNMVLLNNTQAMINQTHLTMSQNRSTPSPRRPAPPAPSRKSDLTGGLDVIFHSPQYLLYALVGGIILVLLSKYHSSTFWSFLG